MMAVVAVLISTSLTKVDGSHVVEYSQAVAVDGVVLHVEDEVLSGRFDDPAVLPVTAPVVHVSRDLDGGVGHVLDLVVPHRDVIPAGNLDAVRLPQVRNTTPVETRDHSLIDVRNVWGRRVPKKQMIVVLIS